MAKTPRSLVLGTAGHIDHGKTTLVRALTGTDTDRLPEEKRRGITIELGFAPWTIAPDLEASIVDVPGHENFVRTMVAGAGGIDAVILVVSAEDGVMPQTREHINVCRLLGVQHGVVALTKIDRLEGDAEAVELAVEDVHEALAGSVFAEAPIVGCSGQTGEGIDKLRDTVRSLAAKIPRRETKGSTVLPLDRVFTIKGHGTVVTGTLQSGVVDLGKETTMQLIPHGEGRETVDVRARGAQVRGADRPRIAAGSRTALNVAGVGRDAIRRGDVVTDGTAVARATAFHAWLHHIPGHSPPWKQGTSLQVCVGTAHGVARLDPLGDAIAPGDDGLVRLRLDAPLPVWHGARVIVRAFADPSDDHQGRTVGGGSVIDPEPSTGRGQRGRWRALGRTLAEAEPAARVLALIQDAGAAGIGSEALARRAGVLDGAALAKRAAGKGGKGGEVVELGSGRFVHEGSVRPLVDAAMTSVDRFHADNPMQPGISRASVEGMLGRGVAPDVAAVAVGRAIDRGALKVIDDQGTLARPGKGLQKDGELPGHMQRVLEIYDRAGLAAPTLKEVQADSGLSSRQVLEIVGVLQRTRRLVKVTQELSLSTTNHDSLVAQVRARLAEQGAIDVQALKAMTGLSRKFAVPFLEHLDQLQITLRKGDARVPGPKA